MTLASGARRRSRLVGEWPGAGSKTVPSFRYDGPVQMTSGTSIGPARRGCALDAVTRASVSIRGVTRDDLRDGDCLVVATRNSTYSLCPLGDGTFSVVGGWFDKKGLSPCRVAVNGCTFGGRAISSRLLAAPGLFLEFANRVTTTRILEVRVLRMTVPS